MARSSQDSASTRASHNYRIIRRVRNSENRRTTEHLPSHVQRHIHRRGCPPRMSVQFIGTTHIHPAIPTRYPPANGSFVMHFHTHIHTHATRPPCLRTNVNHFADTGRGTGVRIPEYSSPGNNPQPPLSFRDMPSSHVNEFTGVQTPAVGCHQQTQNNGGFTSGAQMNAVWPGAVTGGYNPGGPEASLTPGVQTPAVGLGQAVAPPAVGLGLNNGGFTSGAQMNTVWPGAVTGGYNPGGPEASLTPGVQTPAVGLGQAVAPPAVGLGLNNGGFTSGAQMNTVWPGAVTGGYNPEEPGASLNSGVQTPAVGLGQAAPPPAVGLGLNNGGFTSGAQMNEVWPGAVIGGYNPGGPEASLTPGVQAPAVGLGQAAAPLEDFLAPAVSDSFMHMLDQIFRV